MWFGHLTKMTPDQLSAKACNTNHKQMMSQHWSGRRGGQQPRGIKYGAMSGYASCKLQQQQRKALLVQNTSVKPKQLKLNSDFCYCVLLLLNHSDVFIFCQTKTNWFKHCSFTKGSIMEMSLYWDVMQMKPLTAITEDRCRRWLGHMIQMTATHYQKQQ